MYFHTSALYAIRVASTLITSYFSWAQPSLHSGWVEGARPRKRFGKCCVSLPVNCSPQILTWRCRLTEFVKSYALVPPLCRIPYEWLLASLVSCRPSGYAPITERILNIKNGLRLIRSSGHLRKWERRRGLGCAPKEPSRLPPNRGFWLP